MIPMDRKQEVDCMPSVISELSGMINQKLTEVPPSAIRAFDNEISSVPGIIKLTLGEPDFAVPDHVKMAAVRALQKTIPITPSQPERLNLGKPSQRI